jgi:hypothetical protein
MGAGTTKHLHSFLPDLDHSCKKSVGGERGVVLARGVRRDDYLGLVDILEVFLVLVSQVWILTDRFIIRIEHDGLFITKDRGKVHTRSEIHTLKVLAMTMAITLMDRNTRTNVK